MEKLKIEKLFEAINQIADQNLISKEETTRIIEDAVKKAFYSKYDPDAELELIIDEDKNIFKLINNSKLVVSDEDFVEEYNAIEISLSKAKKINAKVKVGEYVAEEIDFSLYSRQIAQQIRQMFTQSIREKKKEAIFVKHKELKGEMVDVTVGTVTNTYVVFTLSDGTTAFMPSKLRNPNIKLSPGEKVSVYVEDVLEDSKDSQIIVSNGSKQVVKRVLEEEVPEILSGMVEIISIARHPGIRTKISVRSNDENIDPVGTIIGSKGVRINAITAKLGTEKLDVIRYSENINEYIANSLSPAKVASVVNKLDDDGEPTKSFIAITPNNQQTLAIGKGGTNVRLAVELVEQRIDVLSMEQAKEKGITFELNVGITEEDIEKIEQGIKINRFPQGNRGNTSQIDTSSIDDSIESFINELENEKTSEVVEENNDINNFEIDENMFTDEELKQMESEFSFDDEIQADDNDDEENK